MKLQTYELNELFIGFHNFYKLMNNIIVKKYGTIKEFIKNFDNNYNILTDNDVDIIKNFIITNKNQYQQYRLPNIMNPKFDHHINYTTYKLIKFEHMFNILNIPYQVRKHKGE